MTMIDHSTTDRTSSCPSWCTTDHSARGAASEWHSAKIGPWVAASALDPDAMAVSVEQFVPTTAAPAVRVDVDSIGAVAFLTLAQAVQLTQQLLQATSTILQDQERDVT